MTNSSHTPNRWPVAIAVAFAVFIAFLAAFIVFASRQNMDLVRRDYYEEEMRFQGQWERLTRTRQVQAEVAVSYNAADQSITVRLPGRHAQPSIEGRIRFYRPSDAGLDREVQLALDSRATQRLDATQLRAGLWRVHVSWRVNGEEYYFERPVVVAPRPSGSKGSKILSVKPTAPPPSASLHEPPGEARLLSSPDSLGGEDARARRESRPTDWLVHGPNACGNRLESAHELGWDGFHSVPGRLACRSGSQERGGTRPNQVPGRQNL
ncbi:MAG: FixH family protein [Verrucomicrobia bacterium]|nr:FixH family protein [Verrucomicrobiota bacterium]